MSVFAIGKDMGAAPYAIFLFKKRSALLQRMRLLIVLKNTELSIVESAAPAQHMIDLHLGNGEGTGMLRRQNVNDLFLHPCKGRKRKAGACQSLRPLEIACFS